MEELDTIDGLPILKKTSSTTNEGLPVFKPKPLPKSVDTTGAIFNPSQPQSLPLSPVVPKNRPQIRERQINDAHANAISVAQQSRQNIQPPEVQVEGRGLMDKIGQALYVPAIKQGFNDLIVNPLAGGTDFIDRTIDKTYKGITGEETPDWLRKKGFFHDVSKQIQTEYDTRDKPKNMVSDVAEGAIGTLPLIASMYTGQGETSIAMKAPQLFGKLAKTLATTKGLTAYKDATDNHEGYLQSLEKGVQGASKGGIEGQFMDAQMLVGGALGKGVANKLAERGLLKGGKAAKAVLHALSVGTVFGGTSAGEDLLQGKEINTDNALKLFGTGLAFELMPVAKGINEELKSRGESKKINDQAAQLAAVVNSASNLNGESAVRTLLTTPIEQIQQVKTDITKGHEDLYADSIEQGAKAFEAKDNNEKKDLYTQQLALKAQGDIKMIADKVSDPKTLERLKNEIYDNEELTDAEVADLHAKLDALAPEPKVKEVEKELSEKDNKPYSDEQKIADLEGWISEFDEYIERLSKDVSDPAIKAENESKLEEIKGRRELYNRNLNDIRDRQSEQKTIIDEPTTPSPETSADVQEQPEQPVSATENSVAPVETPVEEVKPDIRQKAIDAITHGIIGNGERKAKDASPRFDLEMDTAEQKRAIRDITNGKYETAAAKKMIDKVSEFEAKGEYPIIEGDGGNAVRQRGATAEEIQSHIDSAKQFKLAKEQDIELNNQQLKGQDLTHDDFENYYRYRAEELGRTGEPSDSGTVGSTPTDAQRTKNDQTASKPSDTGSETTQGSKPERQPSLSEQELNRKLELRKKFAGRFNDVTNIPTLLADKEFREYAGLVLKEATGDFKAFSKELIDNIGEKIKPHLDKLFAELSEEKTRPSKNEEMGDRAFELGVELKDTKEKTRGEDVVEKEASAKIKDGYDVHELIDRIVKDKHAATDTEVAILNKYIDAKEGEIRAHNERLSTEGATMGKKAFLDLMEAKTKSEMEFQDAAEANRLTGRITAQALNARKFRFNKENSLENMVAKKRQALGGEKLTAEQLADITQKFTDMENIQKQLEARVKKVESDNAKLKAEQTVKRTATNRGNRPVAKAELANERAKIYDDIRSEFKKIRQSGQAMSDIPYRRELAVVAKHMPALLRNLAQDGLIRIEDVVESLYNTFKEDLPDITKNDVTDLIAGKYDEVKPTKSQLQDNIRSLRTQAKLASEIAALEAGIKTEKSPKALKQKNEHVEELRARLKELSQDSEVAAEKNLAALKKRIQDNIDKLSKRIEDGDYSKAEPKKPVAMDQEALTLRRKYDKIKHDFDVQVAKDYLAQRTKTQKRIDNIIAATALPRALKSSFDFSAAGRQGLFLAPHLPEAKTAFKEMFGQAFSEERYDNWASDIKHSPMYDLMKESGLYIADKSDPSMIAREEEFMSTLAERIPGVKQSERAYTAYLNVLRTGVFVSEATKLMERGYTPEAHPNEFKSLARVVNILSGRGEIPKSWGTSAPKILSLGLFSPRFLAARLQTLYLWADPTLSKNAKILAAKDIGSVLGSAASILALATAAGYKVSLNPTSTNFLKIQDEQEDGSTYYDILGGLPQYVRLLSQIATGTKTSASGNVTNLWAERGNENPFGTTSLDVLGSFARGKIAPAPGIAFNLFDGKDVVGQPYGLSNVPAEFLPLPLTDVTSAFQVGGITNALKVLTPATFGIGVSSYQPK